MPDVTDLRDNTEKKLDEIANLICDYSEDVKAENNFGLYSGYIGILIFLSYYNKHKGTERSKAIFDDLIIRCWDLSWNVRNYSDFQANVYRDRD